MTIKLYNKGKSTVYGKGFEFKPETSMAFDDETGARLKSLYPGTLIDMNDVQSQFDKATVVAPVVEAAAPAAETPPPAVEGEATAEAEKNGFISNLMAKVTG